MLYLPFFIYRTHTKDIRKHSYVEFKEQYKQTNNRNRLIDAENRLMVARRVGSGGWVKKVKGLSSTDWTSQISQEAVKCGMGM